MEVPVCESDVLWPVEQKQGYDAFFKGVGFINLPSVLGLSPTGMEIFYAEEGWRIGRQRAYGMGVKASMQATGAKCPFQDPGPALAWKLGLDEEPYLDGDV